MEGGTRSLLDSLLDTAANLSQTPDVNVLRAQAREVAERESRLIAIVNAVGYHDLESLEDFIIKNGAAAVVSLSSLRAPSRVGSRKESMKVSIQPQIEASLEESVSKNFGAGMTKAGQGNFGRDGTNILDASTSGAFDGAEALASSLDHLAKEEEESVSSSALKQDVTVALPSNPPSPAHFSRTSSLWGPGKARASQASLRLSPSKGISALSPPRSPFRIYPTQHNRLLSPPASAAYHSNLQSHLRRVRNYDDLLDAYLKILDKITRYQTWAVKQVSSRPDRLPPIPLSSPLAVFERFRTAWADDGSLESRYNKLKESEVEGQRFLAELKSWKDNILAGKVQKRTRRSSVQQAEATSTSPPLSSLTRAPTLTRAVTVQDGTASMQQEQSTDGATPPPEDTESFLLAMQHTPVKSSSKPAALWSDLRPDGFKAKEANSGTLRRTDRKRNRGSDGAENSMMKGRSSVPKLDADPDISITNLQSPIKLSFHPLDTTSVVRLASPNLSLSQRSIPTPSRSFSLPPHPTINLDRIPVQLTPVEPNSSLTTLVQPSPIQSPFQHLTATVKSTRTGHKGHPSASPSLILEQSRFEDAVESPNSAELKFYSVLGTPPLPAPDWGEASKLAAEMKRKREREVAGKSVEKVERPVKRTRLEQIERDYERESTEKSAKKKGLRKKGVYVDPGERSVRSRTPTTPTTISPAPSSGEMARGPSSDDIDGKRWMDKVHKKRRSENQKKARDKAGSPSAKKQVIEIDPAKNNGEKHHYTEVVRNKEARKSMHAAACDCCTDFHARALGDVGGSELPGETNHFLTVRHQAMQARLQQDSRHRRNHRADPDPPEYWEMGFPTTQVVERINRKAADMAVEKREYQEAEVKQGGFYRYRPN